MSPRLTWDWGPGTRRREVSRGDECSDARFFGFSFLVDFEENVKTIK